ncbi:protoporphyrinogen oxidase [Larsenimonas suaedae]|uniref:Protoporphyrinogen oxidase n=1 Tax=Larsenimonas suaedae TaxID=1851019 RepID=A0ABU1GU19_9GAMM|nr:protoporphyrinogen oxidase [Larsenimonas suaedae]MCM2971927.1 protoporphyrinogen oxidase [Larsenimonas suaedae]MDR5895479.1 protoporphyrinogen oxidase [Larsenimonas suaedae]
MQTERTMEEQGMTREQGKKQDTTENAWDVVIVGAGATGLAAAHSAARRGLRVALLERGDTVGGNIGTRRDSGWQTEIGPNTLMMKPPLYALLEELELLDEAQPANTAARKRFVAYQGAPVALPTHPLNAVTNPLLGAKGWSQVLREPFARSAPEREESLAAFVERRLGRRVLDYMVDPFVSGVYAGDPSRLSAPAAMKRLVALEQKYGSLIRGGLTGLIKARRTPSPLPPEWRGQLVSFPDGLRRLTDRLAERIEAQPAASIHLGCEVASIQRTSGGWCVETNDQRFTTSELVLAVPAHVSARLLEPIDPALARPLEEIVYPSVNAVALGFRAEDIMHPLDGFGLLIPNREQRTTLGVLFSSTLFPNRAPDGHVLLTGFMGGRRRPGVAEWDDNAQVAQVLYDLRDLLGIRGEPVWSRVQRWPKAIPQYEFGHLERIEALDAALAYHEGLSLVGNWRDGIAVGDCLENGRRLGERLAPAR